MYKSSAAILVAQSKAESLFNPYVGTGDANRQLADQIRIIGSRQLTDLVAKRLGFSPRIMATASSSDDVIVLTAIDPDPKQAAAIVNAYAETYLNFRVTSGATQNSNAQNAIRSQVSDVQGQLDQLDQAVAGQPIGQRAATEATQADKRSALTTSLGNLRQQLAQLQAAAAVDQGGAQLLAPAYVPSSPFQPKPVRTGLLGLAVGIMLGLGVALVIDYRDNRIRGKEDLERVAGGLPVVGLIPPTPGWRDSASTHLISVEDPTSASAEAYRSLRTSVQFLALDRSLCTIQVTSPTSSEGKTTTLVNLAVALANAGQRVVVVDCDLRRPRIEQFFGLDPDKGFTSVLLGQVPLSLAVQHVPGIEGLRVLAAGPVPPNPSELLSGRRTSELFETLQAGADFVLIDSPPALPVSDAAVIATQVDATLIVVNDNATTRKQLHRTLELLHQVHAAVVGTVLNRHIQDEATYGYGYKYRPYTPRSPSQARRWTEPQHSAKSATASQQSTPPAAPGDESPSKASSQDRRVKKPVKAGEPGGGGGRPEPQ